MAGTTPARRLLSGLFRLEHVALFGRGRAGLAALLDEMAIAGKPVLVPSNICPAILATIAGAGGLCRPVAVSPDTGLANDARMAAALRADPSPQGVVMPAHLYGFWSSYAETARLARGKGWLLLENDCMASLAAPGGKRPAAIGDALLVSFGPGKTIDAQGGGAILTNDARLASALERRAESWPIVTYADETVETHLTEVRRGSRALGRPAMAEPLLPLDMARLRHRFDDRLAPALETALGSFGDACERRREKFGLWQEALRGFGDEVLVPSFDTMAPWRLICRLRREGARDRLAERLREAGFDVGINYPPLTNGFPQLLAGHAHADADRWGAEVLNFWLSDSYDASRIDRAADLIGRFLAEASP
ncbi:MAG TPA: DegT/DnrJ/EryC1/StrS family aminotransferase [Magnetospirillaceae bacterium]|nr:DegT/DnrJ/EryC1/StrS family aminotransferase [Magnetospirillaceae bacterium]